MITSKQELQTGDNFLVRGSSFLSKSICKVMRKWAKKKGYSKYLVDRVMSHAAVVIVHTELPNIPYLYGSTESGYKPIEFDKHYDWDNDEFIIMRRRNGMNDDQKAEVLRYCLHLTTVSIFYQYWNLIQWILLVYLNFNTFKKDREAFTSCYESCYLTRREVEPNKYPYLPNPDVFMLLGDDNYEIIYVSDKLRKELYG